MPDDSYNQRLPALDLSIQQNTSVVPHDSHFYLLQAGEVLGRYRYLKAAREAWREVLAKEDWKPSKGPKLAPSEKLKREKIAQERSEYFEYWNSGRRHSW